MEKTIQPPSPVSLKSSFSLSEIELLNIPALPEEFLELNFLKSDNSQEGLGLGLQIRDESNTQIIQNNVAFPFSNGPIFLSSIVDASNLTKGDDVKQIIEICMDFSGSGIEFQPGDTIGIIPSNSATEVNQVLHCLQLTNVSDLKFELLVKKDTLKKKATVPPFIPINSTIRHVLETCLDIRSVPKKLFLRVLLEYTSDPAEKRRMQELCSKEGAKEYSEFIIEARTTLLDLLEAFPSCCPPVERLFEVLPRLQARPYSIASSPLAGPLVRIVFSLITLPGSNWMESRHGLCTEWLHSISSLFLRTKSLTQQLLELSLETILKCTRTIPLFLRKGNGFHLPDDPLTPLILIGPGTGIAPFIGFLEHRKLQLEMTPTLKLGEIWLFSGCRYSDCDFIFEEHINEFLKRKIISRFFMAFSRENQVGQAKYVQDNIRLHSQDFVAQLMDKQSTIFVCGEAKNMAKDVWETITAVLQSEKSISKEEACTILNNLKSEQRYIQDIWV